MSDRLVQLATNLEKVLGKRARSIETALGEVTIVVNADSYFESVMLLLGVVNVLVLSAIYYQLRTTGVCASEYLHPTIVIH